jgi:hypothetical protein
MRGNEKYNHLNSNINITHFVQGRVAQPWTGLPGSKSHWDQPKGLLTCTKIVSDFLHDQSLYLSFSLSYYSV